jgi:drug/metabolite transporter (DMT)-like permease
LKPRDLIDLVLLGALWGASFLFTRMCAPEFGPAALSAVRVIGASLLLVPLLAWRGDVRDLQRHAPRLMVVGLANSALPFLCFGFAALSITAGLAAIFNAATPLFGAVIAWLWLRDKPTPSRALGLAIGFAGVVWLAWNKASFKPGGSGWAVVACMLAPMMYGYSASYTKRFMTGLPSLALAAGSQLAASIVLFVPGLIWWPQTNPTLRAWLAAAGLACGCTGLAYVLFFRLIARIGPAKTITVTFLVPAFAVLWGWVFLGEGVSQQMLIGCTVILVGTALATGLVGTSRQA